MTRRLPALAAVLIVASAAHGTEPGFRTIPTRHYVLETDVSDEIAREAAVRMDAMFDEYARRTADFAAAPRESLTFKLYGNPLMFYNAGPPLGSTGVYRVANGKGELLAMALSRFGFDAYTWRIVQHEGFHQFAASAIAGNLPVWVHEGLADYFGHAVFVGDGFVAGVVHERLRKAVVAMIEKDVYAPFPKFMARTSEEWVANIGEKSYLQAWSMAHFLAHGDNGGYQKAFAGYLSAIHRGTKPDAAWREQMKLDPAAFEAAWKKWWTQLPADSTKDLLDEARLRTLASFLRRAQLSGKQYATFEAFLADARKNQVTLDKARWLPASLLADAVKGPDVTPERFSIQWGTRGLTLTEKSTGKTRTLTYEKGVASIAAIASKPPRP